MMILPAANIGVSLPCYKHRGKQAKVHWWYLPDSYDQVIPAAVSGRWLCGRCYRQALPPKVVAGTEQLYLMTAMV